MSTVWQYRFERLSLDGLKDQSELISSLGDLGWELVAVNSTNSSNDGSLYNINGGNSRQQISTSIWVDGLILIFKRPAAVADTSAIKQDIEKWEQLRRESRKEVERQQKVFEFELAERKAKAQAEEKRAEEERKKQLKKEAREAKQQLEATAKEHGLMWYVGWGAIIGILVAWLT